MFPAKRIFADNDYGNKIEAYFTMSALLLNTFEKKDSSKLLKSMKLSNINKAPFVLQGSKNCLFFADSAARANTTVCVEDAKQRADILDSFDFLKQCVKAKSASSKPKSVNKLSNKRRGKSSKKKNKARKHQINQFFKTISNPNQQVFDIPKVRNALIKELDKKGVIYKLSFLFLFFYIM